MSDANARAWARQARNTCPHFHFAHDSCDCLVRALAAAVKAKGEMDAGMLEAVYPRSYKTRTLFARALKSLRAHAADVPPTPYCRADRDGDCEWEGCPQLRDDEPKKSFRHCPLDADVPAPPLASITHKGREHA